MKLSKRERNLLIVLGVGLLLWGYYRFIAMPQIKNLKAKQEESIHYENELAKAQTIIASEKEIDDKFADTSDEISALSQRYFPKTDQSRFILLINELLGGTGLFVQNISFSPLRTEGIGDAQVEIMSVTLPYEGEYPSLLLFLEKLRKHDSEIIIQNLSIKIKEKELLSGSILLDFYSLPDLVEDSSKSYLFDSSETNPDPFYSFEDDFAVDDGEYPDDGDYDGFPDDGGYHGGDGHHGKTDLSGVKINFDSSRILLEGFDSRVLNFVPSHPGMRGQIAVNRNSKQGSGSLGLYYNFPPIEDIKYIHAVLNKDATIVQPPEGMGLWVYSYDSTGHGIILGLKDKEGNKHDLDLCEEVNWTGWKHLKVDIPNDKFEFPVKVESIIIEIKSPEHGKGTLLFDALEAFYTMDYPDVDDDSTGDYRVYDVQAGDTLSSISKAFYDDASKQNVIKKYNGIKGNWDLKPGKTIIIPNI